MSVINKVSSAGTTYDINDLRIPTVDFVKYGSEQSITEEQKTTAASNIGIKNFIFTIPANIASGTAIPITGVKSIYACTPWLNPVFSGNALTDEQIYQAYMGLRAIYITTAANAITLTFSGGSPVVDIPCNLTVWG